MRRGKKGHVLNACDTLRFAKKKKAPSSNVREAKGAESRAAEGRRELCQRDAALSWQEGTSATTASLCLFFLLTVAGLSICVRVGLYVSSCNCGALRQRNPRVRALTFGGPSLRSSSC